MRLRITHTTTFRYDEPVSEAYMEMRLRPLDAGGQRCESFRLSTDPPGEVRGGQPGIHRTAMSPRGELGDGLFGYRVGEQQVHGGDLYDVVMRQEELRRLVPQDGTGVPLIAVRVTSGRAPRQGVCCQARRG